ncbi:MAG: sigma factor-like helix-turn-helix DNA-binding protein [archaeon]
MPSYESRQREKGEPVLATKETPIRKSILHEEQTLTQRAIERLPADEREAIVATFFDGVDRLEVAEQMGIEINELDTILNRAYQKLARELKELK